MLDINKSGQKIKAKVSKMPIPNLNVIRTGTAHARQSSFSSYNSEQDFSAREEELRCTPQEEKEREEVFRYYGISEDYERYFQPKDEGYIDQVCRNRISKFANANSPELDVRDERIAIPLNSQYLDSFAQSKYNKPIDPLLDEIRDWLIDLVEITTSISFNHLKRGHITEKEVKNYAAKNTLLNIKQMIESLGKMPLHHRYTIMKFINQQLQSIFQNVIQKYPQSGSRGASRRIQSKIRRIDNRESDELDFLHKNNLQIPYRKSGDYAEDVMRILNKLIAFPADAFHPNDENEETNFEVFTEIMEHIFENAYSQPVSTTASDIAEIIGRKVREKGENILLSSTNVTELREALSFSDRVDKKSSYNKDLNSKDYSIGQKIPNGTPLFTEEELEGANFKIHDSSILRILTKWAEELRNKLADAEQTITKRAHKFKTKTGKFVNLQLNLRERLYFVAQQEEKKIQSYMEYIKKENFGLQSILSEEKNIGRYSKHDIQVGIYAAKMNEIASQYMFKYINKLVHALLLLPKVAAREVDKQTEKSLLSSVNLLTLKIGDLMRSRYSCNEQQFLKVLSVLQELDCKHPEILKIVRIKNRLDHKDNDVLINVYFMNKVQCEIQLSIKGLQSKVEKDYSNFNHFLYEVIRSQLGPVSELANIVGQYDPLIHNFKKMPQYGPEILSQNWLKEKKKVLFDNLVERLKFKKEMGVGRCLELPFICCKCFNLSIVNNPNFYFRDPTDLKLTCNHCLYLNTIEECCAQGYSYLADYNFKKEDELNGFCKKHLEYWQSEKIIKEMEEDIKDQSSQECRMVDIPLHGLYVKKTSRTPKLVLYSATYEPVSNYYIFTTVDEKGNKKLVTKISLYLEKKKRLEALKKGLGNIFIFKFENTRKRVENGCLYLACTAPNCCGKEVRVGPIIPAQEMMDIAHSKAIQSSLQTQKSLLNLNTIPKSFEKLDRSLKAIKDAQKIEKITRGIHHIKAFDCGLTNIEVTTQFANLIDLNINNNRQIKSLKGLQSCLSLKNLECKNCDIEDIEELSTLRKIEYLNLSWNEKLESLEPLRDHTEIVELSLSHTPVCSLEPLANCLKLQSLDLQGCKTVQALSSITSSRFAYLNIIDCTSLKAFDLPSRSISSLKCVQYYKKSKEKIGLELILASLNYLQDDLQEEDGRSMNQQTIMKINDFLKLNRTENLLQHLIRTVP